MRRDSLATYRAKRDFRQTAEPSGKEAVPAAEQLRFVVQRHDATRLHYDFRLELDGVFLSWAVTKGPSLDPTVKRLAVQTEDHPLDYGDFEGTIPEDQYGGGTVQLWDRGYWIPEGDPHEGLKKGDLKFTLVGHRLEGSWVLVRMKWGREKGDSKRTNWLLIKHRDDAAHEGDNDKLLEDNDTSVASGRTLKEIAIGAGKAPTPFMTAKKRTAGAVWQSNKKGGGKTAVAPESTAKPKKVRSIPAFVEPQLAKLVEQPTSEPGWVHEVKFDGYRLQLRVVDGKATLKTRKGLDWTARFQAIADVATDLPDCMIDGEACALDKDGVPNFSALQVALSEGRSQDMVFFAFDAMFAEGEDLRDLPLIERKERLQALLSGLKDRKRLIRYVEHLETAGDAVLASARKMGLEGIISKRADAPYRSTRANTWLKAKCRAGQEVIIGGWTQEGAKLRSLIVGVHRGQGKKTELVPVGRVGTGFSGAVTRRVLPELKKVESKTSAFAADTSPRKEANMHWARPELVAEIEFAGWTGDGNVRQAAFKGLRIDKPAKEIEAEKPAKPEKTVSVVPTGARSARGNPRALAERRDLPMATRRKDPSTSLGMTKTSGSAPSGPSAVMGVTISHPDKPLWPDEKPPLTKIELARYYEAVGDWMLPHIQGRPCSLVRTPDGIGGQQFFQRHVMPGSSELITEAKVSGEKKPYVQLDRVEALAAAAQIGATELHPWNGQPGEPELPGRLVFDLDPAPDVGFNEVVKGALALRKRLEKLGLATFCKTTGGKGLHVVTPLTADEKSPGWDAAKMFAKEICRRLADAEPDRFLLSMAKKERTGRIFLDYLRNDRTSTAVAPLSPRARDGATVSMPLEWSQVKAGLDPKRFTVRTAPALLSKSKAWRGYDKAAVPLRKAIQALIDAKE
ncbi:MAG: DNA ligase D [Reyranella sp.]|uniref:DNA ligase D n=1 Tax=Reyranella sp. TaxID=1929291 RepID=UPI001AC94507|nr:DNA ligase D [Reyranella sp.]MBN9087436.1 DNA ligase D [Reyranella sp.]